MGDLFRSEEMALVQLFIQPEAAYSSVAELGEMGCVQFRDLNEHTNAFQRKFVTEVRQCDELQRRIRYIENELRRDNIKLPVLNDNQEPNAPNPRQVIDLEAHLESVENELRELAANGVSLKSNYQNLSELKYVLTNTADFFSSEEVLNLDSNRYMDPHEQSQGQRGQLGFVAGVIKLERFFAFERMLWRISRGNIFVKHSVLNTQTEDPETGRKVVKTVFVAFFQGEQLKVRIKKVCAGFHASLYPCPSAHKERVDMLADVKTRLEDLKMILNQTDDHRNRVLVAASRNLPIWNVMVRKMMAIYHILNMLNTDVSGKCLIGEGWVPVRDLPTVKSALSRGSKEAESSIPSFMNVIATHEQPPTYTHTNKFTSGFQNLIDAYGMASYREVNPALYTCITFPFLFGVMFGDLGHGIILVIFASILILRERKFAKINVEIFQLFFGGRYMILLMGLFAIYAGFIYNDVFSKSMNVFGSGWKVYFNESTVLENPTLQLRPKFASVKTYPIGLDPVWQMAKNKIIFLNSFKMKLSIIFGVLHMTFGIFMSLINFNFFKKRMNILLEFIPQVIFLILLFGYMSFMMFFKWTKYNDFYEDGTKATEHSPGCAPSILILFINMMLMGHYEPQLLCKEYMFEGQSLLQMVFLVISLICIPWLLLSKPFYVMCTRPKPTQPANGDAGRRMSSVQAGRGGGHGSDDEPLSEVFVQQAIHTIEYILSTISHTASYLRLWALSLAHSQLSEVLWTKIISLSFSMPRGYEGVLFIIVLFPVWAFLTIAILVVIEGLSAFLHTLRLHWVEFMSKFYEGLGYAFEPFSFRSIPMEDTVEA